MSRDALLLGWHFHCDDPTILLPEEAITKWHGSKGRCDSFEGTHYGLLGKTGDRGGFVQFDGFVGYVPSKRNPLAFAQGEQARELVILETFDWDEDLLGDTVLQMRDEIPTENWESRGDFTVGARGAIMAFHAAADGLNWNDSLEAGIRITLRPGNYEILFVPLSNVSSLTYWKWKQGEV